MPLLSHRKGGRSVNRLKKGDKVVMHTCIEANYHKYYGRIWTCKTDQFKAKCGSDVVFLEGFSGYFSTIFLQLVNLEGERHENHCSK